MSWDFTMEAPACPTCGHAASDDDRLEDNYTYNVAPMFWEAFGLSVENGIRGLNGITGEKAGPLLQAAIEAMRSDPGKYEAMNPENGWGSYDGAVKLLCRLNGWCVDHPTWTLRVS